jgi:hypothetical protein
MKTRGDKNMGSDMTAREIKPMYSPDQIGISTFVGGPLAGAHLVWANFNSLGKPELARLTTIISVATLFVLVILGFLLGGKNHSGNLILPLLVGLAAKQVANTYQLKKAAIADSEEYSFQSNWKVLGITIFWLIATMVLLFAVIFALLVAGVHFPK